MKHRNVVPTRIFMSILVFLGIILSSVMPAHCDKKNFNLYFTFEGNTSAGGIGASEMREIMALTIYKVMEKTGYNFHIMIVPTWKDIYEKLYREKVDFLYTLTMPYIALKEDGINLKPVSAPYFGIDEHACIFAYKNSGIKDISDLKGKKLAISNSHIKGFEDYPSKNKIVFRGQEVFISDFYDLEYTISRNGLKGLEEIDFIIDFPNFDSRILALDRGIVDAAFADSLVVDMYRFNGRELKNVVMIDCNEKMYGTFLAATENVSDKTIRELQMVLKEIFENPDDDVVDLMKRSNVIGKGAGFHAISDNDLEYHFTVWNTVKENASFEKIHEIVSKLINE